MSSDAAVCERDGLTADVTSVKRACRGAIRLLGCGETDMRGERGYAMAALLVMLSVMGVALSVALPVWHTVSVREKEAELIFRGEQYARAVVLFQRRYAGALPPNIDVLLNERFLRKRYKDPITGDDFQVVGPGTPLPGVPGADAPDSGGATGGPPARLQQLMEEAARRREATPSQFGQRVAGGPTGGVLGVASRSTERSLGRYNGRERYNEWVFLATEMSQTPGGVPGEGTPGPPGGGRGIGQPGPGGRGIGQPGAGGGFQLPGGRGAGGRGAAPPPGGRGQ